MHAGEALRRTSHTTTRSSSPLPIATGSLSSASPCPPLQPLQPLPSELPSLAHGAENSVTYSKLPVRLMSSMSQGGGASTRMEPDDTYCAARRLALTFGSRHRGDGPRPRAHVEHVGLLQPRDEEVSALVGRRLEDASEAIEQHRSMTTVYCVAWREERQVVTRSGRQEMIAGDHYTMTSSNRTMAHTDILHKYAIHCENDLC